MKGKVLIITGPTASGKSKIAVDIARSIGGEIVSADSMQVYRQMDIGTAKPEMDARKQIPHFMIDIVDPDEEFNAGMYMQMGREVINDILRREKKPIVVGGTGLYIRALTKGIVKGPGRSDAVRDGLLKEMRLHGLDHLYNRLKEVDPDIAEKIHPCDSVRIVRALEVFSLTNTPLSSLQSSHAFKDEPYETLKIGISMERNRLYRKIEDRVDKMIGDGLVEEVDSLLKKGYSPYLKSMQSLGYKEIIMYLSGTLSMDDAVYLIKRNTKRYAKRQLTWFRKESDIEWMDSDTPIDGFIKRALDFFER